MTEHHERIRLRYGLECVLCRRNSDGRLQVARRFGIDHSSPELWTFTGSSLVTLIPGCWYTNDPVGGVIGCYDDDAFTDLFTCITIDEFEKARNEE